MSPPTGSGTTGTPPRRLHIVGAGAAGAELAALAVAHGLEVRLRDGDAAALAGALRAVRAGIAADLAGGRIAPSEAEARLARLRAALEPVGLGLADLAVEAVAEDLDAKRRVLAELEVRMRPGALLATATAELAVDELAAGLQHPERFLGLHLPQPAGRGPLVEVVAGTRTAAGPLAAAVDLVGRLERVPVVVKDAPGRAADRLLMAGLLEALRLLEEGYRAGDVDAALRDFGMARGPLATLRAMGLEAVARRADGLARAFPHRFAPLPPLGALPPSGWIARLAGRRRPAPPGALAERVVLAMVNEAAACLEDGVVADAAAMDLVSLHGAGFPPSRGGILRHATALGLAQVEARLLALRAEKGERFRPVPLLARLAAAGGTFDGPLSPAP